MEYEKIELKSIYSKADGLSFKYQAEAHKMINKCENEVIENVLTQYLQRKPTQADYEKSFKQTLEGNPLNYQLHFSGIHLGDIEIRIDLDNFTGVVFTTRTFILKMK